ncbi:MAG: hypothetical protein KBG48_10665 [Kofleriaceae bacterium]|jgi:hypothetical protein|nr:hypothetical protein [Kofleriaceae bacterium]MBP9167843.1 hypothetical protein [Kofleriaceae bacterium]MBP9859350.1 hypothetical protein [Kofleriaceae bacterium]
MTTLTPNHPGRRLLFEFESDPPSGYVAPTRTTVDHLRAARAWTVSAPELIDEHQEDDEEYLLLGVGDIIHTLGVSAEVYSRLPPWGDLVPPHVDRAQLADVGALVEAMSALSRKVDDNMIVALDGVEIGWIERGNTDGISVGLLTELGLVLAGKG